MQRSVRWALAAFGLAALAIGVRADEEARPVGVGTPSDGSTTDWFVLPVAFYLPETSLGLALSGGYHFGTDRGIQTSSVHAVGAYTLNSQASMSIDGQLFAGESLALTAKGLFSVFPSHFFGIGNGARREDDEAFTSRLAEVQLASEIYLVPRRLRTGPKVAFRKERFFSFAPGGQLGSGRVPGTSDYTRVGLGWSLSWDTRDSLFAPRRGEYLEASYLFMPGGAASGGFGRGHVDARHFTPLGVGHVLGIETRVDYAHGDVPFTVLPRLGGGAGLRGYFDGRYRDRIAYLLQAEYRFPLVWRVGGAAFAGAGGVAAAASELSIEHVRPAAGAGLRFRLTEDGVVLRADVAVGQDGANVYVLGMQAF
jgi:outer membrane translocation and assembly module TamA